MEQDKQPNSSDKRSPSPPTSGTPTTGDIVGYHVLQLLSKDPDTLSDKEKQLLADYRAQLDERRKEQEAKQKKLAEEKAKSDQRTREYWAALNRMPATPPTPSLDTFTAMLQRDLPKRQQQCVSLPPDTLVRYLYQAYRAVCLSRGADIAPNDTYLAARLQAVAKWLHSHNKPGLLLRGYVGVGKTTMLRAVSITLTNLNQGGFRIVSAMQINDMAKEDKAAYEELRKVDKLGIDDLGVEAATVKDYGNERSPIVELLTQRYDKYLTTFITTNLTIRPDGKDEIEERYGLRIADRIREMCNTLAYDSSQKSYRT